MSWRTPSPNATRAKSWPGPPSSNNALLPPRNVACFNQVHPSIGPRREDVSSWMDLLDLEDFVSFGGKS